MADLQDPSRQTPKKHKVIHWNPEEDDLNANANPGVKAYLGGAVAMLLVLVIGLVSYFLFFYTPPSATATAEDESAQVDPRRVFESISRAQGVKDAVDRKLDAASQMPITGNEVLRQKLINIQKAKYDADDLMQDSRFPKAIAQYNAVDALIEEFTTEVENKQKARGLYDDFLVRSSELEIGKHLNQESFEAAFGAASEGKNFLDAGSFSPALQRMEEAAQSLDQVENAIQDYIRGNAAQGNRFIAQGKSPEAVEAFTKVLELDPANEEALKQLQRARVADKVFAALQAAKQNEGEGEFETALGYFKQAASIDSGSAKAQSGVARVNRKIEERDFTIAYSAAQVAIAESKYEDAIRNYQAALAIFPERTDIESAISRARAEKRQNDIVTRITQAYDFERVFDWESARNLYQELVNMEPELQEAKDGLLRTGRMIRSILRYETLLEVAKTEAQRTEFQLAIRTFDEAMRSKPEYLPLTEDGERLRKFLQLQSQPVRVTLVSDGSTWVSVQGPSMRKPEKFDSTVVSLLPGKYFIIGRKKGYQDVRFGLQIRAGMTQEPITVSANIKNDY
ncbi:tetratricopeptide repeat domain protein [Verrucomicrobiia bacterium DG1235]|nr:tetratricopeptide repeat domain protein [Verrucomicrobiae bacterium DG1235]